jgi:hypothetical protein
LSSQSPPKSVPTAPTVSAAAWEPGPDTRVFVGPSLNDAIAAARFELGRQVEIRSARKVRQGMRARTRFEVLAVIPAEPDVESASSDDALDGSTLDLFTSAPAPVIPAQGTTPPLPPLADPAEAVAATLAAMLADADDREAGIADAQPGESDFAADLARQISARALDPVFQAAVPPTVAEPSPAVDRDLPSSSQDGLDGVVDEDDPEATPDPTFAARVRAALGRVALEPEPTMGEGPHPDLDLLDPENPGGPAAEIEYPERVFPRPRASESPRGLPDLATAGAPPGSLPQSAPPAAAPVEAPAVQPWQARALDLATDPPVSRVSTRSRQQQAEGAPEVAKRVFRTNLPPTADTDPATPVVSVPDAVEPAVPVVVPRVERLAAAAIGEAATPLEKVTGAVDEVAAPRRARAPRSRDTADTNLAVVPSDGDQTPATLAGWSRVRLSRLGVPREVINKLPALDPIDDLGWLRALRIAIEAVVRPAQPGASASAVVNGTGAASAMIILRAAAAGATPGTLTMDGRTMPASPTELALAVRSCVVS